MNWNEAYGKLEQPNLQQIVEFVNCDMWEKMDIFLQQNFNTKPKIEYSGCSWQAGWNVKYKKSSKNLCTLYPMNGYFVALVVIRETEMVEAETLVSLCSEYVKNTFYNTKVGNGQKWVMFDVKDDETLKAVMSLVELRAKALGLV